MTTVYIVNLIVSGLVQGLIIALAALSINLVFAIARFPNAAAGDFLTIGAYNGILIQKGLGVSVLLAGLGSTIATAVCVMIIFRLAIKPLLGRSIVAPLLSSIGITLFVRYAISFFVEGEQYTFDVPIVRALNFGGVRILPIDLYVGAAALVTLAVVFLFLFKTPLGRQMRAVADNPNLARASGIRSNRVMLVLWLIVGAICGVGGVILGVKTVVVPDMGWNLLLPAFAAAVLGGVGSLSGSVIAGILLGVVQELSAPFVGFTYKLAISFVVLAAILIFRPQGFFGESERVR
jgi:branched-chain amino acid transport system permease protein